MEKKQLVKTLKALAVKIDKTPETAENFGDLLSEVIGLGIDVFCLSEEAPTPDTVHFYPSPSLRYHTPNGSALACYNEFRVIVAGTTASVKTRGDVKLWADRMKHAAKCVVEQMNKIPVEAAPDQNIEGN